MFIIFNTKTRPCNDFYQLSNENAWQYNGVDWSCMRKRDSATNFIDSVEKNTIIVKDTRPCNDICRFLIKKIGSATACIDFVWKSTTVQQISSIVCEEIRQCNEIHRLCVKKSRIRLKQIITSPSIWTRDHPEIRFFVFFWSPSVGSHKLGNEYAWAHTCISPIILGGCFGGARGFWVMCLGRAWIRTGSH